MRSAAPAGEPGLAVPTLKAALALALTTAAAAALGAAIGLPLPSLDGGAAGGGGEASAAGLLSGQEPAGSTAPGLYQGPYFPVLGRYGFGEKDARFGASRGGHVHEGQDVFAKPGTPLVAVSDGVVVDRGTTKGRWSGGRGNYLMLYSPIEDRSYVYLHMRRPAMVALGERVRAGQRLGAVGCTGSCFGPHLHFEIRRGKASFGAETKPLDPLPVIRDWPQAA